MKRLLGISFLFVSVCAECFAQTTQSPVQSPATSGQTPMDTQPVTELKPTGSLGTCGYKPTEKEAAFFKKLDPKEQVNGSFLESYGIRGKKGTYVAWFGITRGVLAATDGKLTMLFEHKYFDGMTDCHIMLVSRAGAGDFQATLGPIEDTIAPLTLVRAYGTVDGEEKGVPHLIVDYIRVWPWMTFTFTDLGPKDKSNPEWAKYCQICKRGRIYNPYPNKNYYLGMLGDPKDFGTVPREP